MPRAAKSRERKAISMKRPEPEGLAPFIDPLRMHPPPNTPNSSTSAPIQCINATDLSGDTTTENQSTQETQEIEESQEVNRVPPTQTPVVDVNAKVQSMLQAHEALKGNENNTKASAHASKKSQWFTKITDKIIMPGKKVAPSPKTHYASKKKVGSAVVGKPFSPVHMRLNESRNLNRQKVQKIAGNTVSRKPVANNGNTITEARTPPSCHEETLKLLETIGSDSSAETICPFPKYVDPFTGETDFEEDLETGVLKGVPDAYSTPRPSLIRGVLVDSLGSPQRNPTIQRNQRPGTARARDFSNFDSNTESEDGGPIAEKIMQSPENENKRHLAVPESWDGEVRVKKHPSPGVGWFSNVDAAIMLHSRLQSEGATQSELDELSQTLTGLGSLAQRDNNRMMYTKPIANRRDKLATPDASTRVSFPQRPSRIPRPSKRTNRQPVAMKRLRPKEEDADEVDELF